jgi:cysteine-rich repeat protein
MKRLHQCMIGLVAAVALLLGAAGQSWAACGNGVLDFDPIKGTNEECDQGQALCTGGLNDGARCSRASDCIGGTCSDGPDNRDDLANHCRSDCTLPRCGDGVSDSDNNEQCDDGNSSNTDGCLNTCRTAACGDGFRCTENNPTSACPSGKEQCDDGNLKSGDGCSGTCRAEVCGDGIVNGSDECDAGQATCTGSNVVPNGYPCATTAECFGGTCGAGNRDDVANNCRSDCTLPTCGDGVTDSGNDEACDDGNSSNSDGCLNSCELNVCGDGFRCTENNPASPCNSTPGPFGKEQCDDGNSKTGDGCDATCRLESCGNGTPEPGEQCDAGQSICDGTSPTVVQGVACSSSSTCLGGACAGGNLDDVANTCRSDCSLPRCGDGVQDGGEACDDGNSSNNDGCTTSCQVAACGDGFRCTENNPTSPCPNGKESCDDGNTKAGDGCSNLCFPELCGDGTINGSDQCDFGFAACSAASLNAGALCQTDSDCPGGACDACYPDILAGIDATGASPHLVCNSGGPNSDDTANFCRSDCTLPRCGDGVVDAGEACDDGNSSNNDTCLNNCLVARCGDGNVCNSNNLKDPADPSDCDNAPDGREQCDDGNTNPLDGCDACALTSCGDGIVQAGEQCDLGQSSCDGTSPGSQIGVPCSSDAQCLGGVCGTGNLDAPNTCKPNCRLPACGDGVSDSSNNEQCDGAPTVTGSCNANCRINTCGDGVLGTSTTALGTLAEQCDDGNTFDGDGCSQYCTVEMCGDGITTQSFDPAEHEECDAGLPLQHPDPNGGPTPVQNQGNCTSVCCWYGGTLPVDQNSSPTLPVGTFTNIDGTFDSLTGCHLPKLINNASCSRYVQRPSIRLSKLISQGRSAYNSNNFQKAIRKLRRAKRVMDQVNRALIKSRVAAACQSISHVLSDQMTRISSLNSDVQNMMPLF